MTETGKKKRIYALIIVISIGIALIGGFIIYTQLSLFDVRPLPTHTLNHYMMRDGLKRMEQIQDDKFGLSIPYSEINNELEAQFMDRMTEKHRVVNSIEVNIQRQVAYANVMIHQMYIPVVYVLNEEFTEGGLIVTFTPEGYGRKDLRLLNVLDRIVLAGDLDEPLDVPVDILQDSDMSYIIMDDIHMDDDGVGLVFEVQIPHFMDIMQSISSTADYLLKERYRTGTEKEQQALNWLERYAQATDSVKGAMVKDYLNGGVAIAHLLVLADKSALEDVYETVPTLDEVVPQSTILEQQDILENQAIIDYGQQLVSALEQYSKENAILIYQGHPFELKALATISIDDVAIYAGLNIRQNILDKMQFAFIEDTLYVIAKLEGNRYLGITSRESIAFDEETYKKTYYRPLPEIGQYTTDPVVYDKLYDAMYSYYGEDVFIRYLKNGSEDAFGIISLSSDYQNYRTVVLSRVDGEFEVIGDSYPSIVALNAAHSNFNLNLTTHMFETSHILLLNYQTKENVKRALVEQGILEEGEDLAFFSYDGVRYISIMLNNGDKYIYTIYRSSFLENLYPLEEALTLFDDIDPLILLQERPE